MLMKQYCLTFVLLLIGVRVRASPFHRYGWQDGTEYLFRYESQTLTGIPDIRQEQAGGVKLASDVRVQAMPDYSLRVRFVRPRLVAFNQEVVPQTESGRVTLDNNAASGDVVGNRGNSSNLAGDEGLPSEFKDFLATPYSVHLKGGRVRSFVVSADEPTEVTNLKRALLAQISLDMREYLNAATTTSTSSSIRNSSRQELAADGVLNGAEDQMGSSSWEGRPRTQQFEVYEESIQGECKTTYTLAEVAEEEALVGTGCRRFCGENYRSFKVTKTTDLDKCKVRPVYQRWAGVDGDADLSRSSGGATFEHMTSASYSICGSSDLRDFTILDINVDDETVFYPLGVHTDEKFHSRSKSSLELLAKKPFSVPMPLPSDTREERSLVYQWVNLRGPEILRTVSEETEAMFGFRPVLGVPSLTGAPASLIPRTLHEDAIVRKAGETIRKISRIIHRTPKSKDLKAEDVVGLLTTVVKYLRHLGLDQLKRLEAMVEGQRQVFYEILCKVGSNPAVVLLKERIVDGRLIRLMGASEATHLVQSTILNVNTPTPELMRELVRMAKFLASNGTSAGTRRRESTLLTVSLLQLSNLFYNAYVHPSNMYTKYPARIYGVFGTSRSEVLVSEYLPFLERLLVVGDGSLAGQEDLEGEKVRLVAIVALGKLGQMDALRVLAKVVENGGRKFETVQRALAVYSMKRLALRNPSEIKEVLMAIIVNPSENEQVRIAAVAVLAYASPTTTQLQRLAMLTWEDQLSKQLRSFIDSTIRNLAESHLSEPLNIDHRTASSAAAASHFLKPSDLGIQYSQNHHSDHLIGYLEAVFSQKLGVANTRNGLLPTRVSFSNDMLDIQGTWKIQAASFAAYVQGMDRVVEDFLSVMGQTNKASRKVEELLRQVRDELQLDKGPEAAPRAFVLSRIFGFDSTHLVDFKAILGSLETLIASMSSYSNVRKEFSLFRSFRLVEVDCLSMSVMGLPYVFHGTSAVLLNGNGTLSTAKGGNSLKAKVKVFPIVNFKVQVDGGLMIPFTRTFVGASVAAGLIAFMPVEVDAKIEDNEVKLAAKVPAEEHKVETEGTLQAYVQPYTVTDSYVSMEPTTLASLRKPILFGLPKKVVEKQVFPESMGIDCKLKMESDVEYIDFASLYHKLKELGLASVMHFPASLVSTLRQTSIMVVFSPSRSETKEVEFIAKFGFHKHGELVRKVEKIKEAVVKHDMHSVKAALNSLAVGSKVSMVHLETVLKGEGDRRGVQAGFMVGYKPLSHHKTKSVMAIDLKSTGHPKAGDKGESGGAGGGTYGFLLENEVEVPKIDYRWDVDKLLAQPLKMKLESKVVFGQRNLHREGQLGGDGGNEVEVKAEFFKTEDQIESVKKSAEYAKCQQEVGDVGRAGMMLLSPICARVRHQAASLDKMVMTFKMPQPVATMGLWKMLEGFVLSTYFPLAVRSKDDDDDDSDLKKASRKGSSSSSGKVEVEARLDRLAAFAEIKVAYGDTEFRMEHVPVPTPVRWFLPISVRNNLHSWFLQRVTSFQAPASCRIGPQFVSTFDNLTYPYRVNDCGHVLVTDRKGVFPVAVLTRSLLPSAGGGHGSSPPPARSVKILSGHFDVELTPPRGSSGPASPSAGFALEVTVNGRRVNLARGQIFTEKSSSTGRVIFEVERYLDDVYHVFVVEQGVEVLTNGRYTEVILPQTFRARSAGLCGDLNGEKTADLRSPKMCIMKAKVAGVAYMLNKAGGGSGLADKGHAVAPRCSGIPADLKVEYDEEVKECVEEREVTTKVESTLLHSLPSRTRPRVSAHSVIVGRFEVCLSRETLVVNPSGRGEPDESYDESSARNATLLMRFSGGGSTAGNKGPLLTFVCLPKQSILAQSLLNKAKAGENLTPILKGMPLSFKEVAVNS